MQNFTEDIKNEITAEQPRTRAEAAAMLSAFIRTSGSIISKSGNIGFEIVTENERTAEFFMDVIESNFNIHPVISGAKFDLMSGKDKVSFSCVCDSSAALLEEMRIVKCDKNGYSLIFGIDDALFPNEECKLAFLKGAFLGGGSCTLPENEIYSRSGYHFETVFSNKTTADGFSDLLCDFDILSKLVTRKDSAVVYVKSKEVISDILNVLSCEKCLDKLNKISEIKDLRNNANRVNNCSVSNIDKTVTASVKQVRAIEIISETIGLQSLDKPLFEVATCRLADKNASLQDMADRLGISKSCINHRFRKIIELAQSLNQD